jgi:hypothetical protein
MPQPLDSKRHTDQHILPEYAYLPGITPQPAPLSQGSVQDQTPTAIAAARERGRVLFDHGFYWEAHEAWEIAWQDARRNHHEPAARLLKARIKLAACGVKCLQRNPAGARHHALRARQLLLSLQEEPASSCGVSAVELAALTAFAQKLCEQLPEITSRQQSAAHQGGIVIFDPLPRPADPLPFDKEARSPESTATSEPA